MRQNRRFIFSFYLVASVVLMVASLIGGIVLVKKNQDNRNLATGCTCFPEDTGVCKGDWFHPSCNGAFTCQGTKSCPSKPKPTGSCTREQCDFGSTTCQGGPDNNTGYSCNCVCAQNPETGHANVTVWSCGTYSASSCPPKSGIPGPPGSIICRKDNPAVCPSTHSATPAFERMVGMFAGQPSSCSFYDACGGPVSPGQSCVGLSKLSNGEPNHGVFVGCNGQKNCFCDTNFSSTVQCYDDVGNDSCGAQVIAAATSVPRLPVLPTNTPVPTSTPKLTSTPVPTNTPTRIPTNTPTRIPTNTPTPVLTSTPGPTSTPTLIPTVGPSSTPGPIDTPTPIPQNTNIPQPTNTTAPVANGPSPTRIILPQSGVEFPLQALTILGAIVTLAGFLILL